MSNDELEIVDERLNAESGRHVFITGPRNNAVHTEAVGKLAEALTNAKVPIYVAKPVTGKKAAQHAQENRAALIDALFVVAMLDVPEEDPHRKTVTGWPTPSRIHHIFRVNREPVRRIGAAAIIDAETEVMLTDPGVLRDIGFADACGLQVVGYVHSGGAKFALDKSVAVSIDGTLRGIRKWVEFVGEFDGFDKANAFPWSKLQKVTTK